MLRMFRMSFSNFAEKVHNSFIFLEAHHASNTFKETTVKEKGYY